MKKSEKCEVCNESIVNVAGDVWTHGYGNMDKHHKPEPARSRLEPVEAPKVNVWDDPKMLIGAILDRIDMAPNDDPLPYVREYVDGIRKRMLKGKNHEQIR